MNMLEGPQNQSAVTQYPNYQTSFSEPRAQEKLQQTTRFRKFQAITTKPTKRRAYRLLKWRENKYCGTRVF